MRCVTCCHVGMLREGRGVGVGELEAGASRCRGDQDDQLLARPQIAREASKVCATCDERGSRSTRSPCRFKAPQQAAGWPA